MLDAIVNELGQEAAITRRVLERVPEDKLAWKPHAKSMSLVQLALHVASLPRDLSRLAQLEEFDASQANFEPPTPSSVEEILTTHDVGLRVAQDCLNGLDERAAQRNWSLRFKGDEVFTVPRVGLIRSLMLNHWYHHRGQLSVYLRLLEVPLPVIYGRSADENPFA
jgi:uncharacterized damage-inducible protein DinB